MAKQVTNGSELYCPLVDSRLDVRACPSADGLSFFFQALNERRRAEAAPGRHRLLSECVRAS